MGHGVESAEAVIDQETVDTAIAQAAFAGKLRRDLNARFGPGDDKAVIHRVLDFFDLASGKGPQRLTFLKWWQGETLPSWPYRVQLAILLGHCEDWLIFMNEEPPRYPDMARAIFRAASKTHRFPKTMHVLAWIEDQLDRAGVTASRQSVANWVTGAVIPQVKGRMALEDILGMRRGDLLNPELYLVRDQQKSAPKSSRSAPAEDATIPEGIKAAPHSAPSDVAPVVSAMAAALSALTGGSADPQQYRHFLKKELMNRYLISAPARDITAVLAGNLPSDPKIVEAMSEILKIDNLAADLASQKVNPSRKAVTSLAATPVRQPNPVRTSRTAKPGIAAEALNAVKEQSPDKTVKSSAVQSETRTLPDLPPKRGGGNPDVLRPKPAQEAKPVPRVKAKLSPRTKRGRQNAFIAGTLLEALTNFPDAPQRENEQMRFLKQQLRDRFLLRVKLVDVQDWLRGNARPSPEQLKALAQILNAWRLVGL